METKKCNICGIEKPIEDFRRKAHTRGTAVKLDPRIKSCTDCAEKIHGYDGKKMCRKCLGFKPIEDFAADKRRKDGKGSYCNECRHQEHRSYLRRRPQAHLAQVRRRNLRLMYGISVDDYEAMLVSQNGVCAICVEPCGTGKRLAVDHDHATGTVRGLLCARCNFAIGQMDDDPNRLRTAADYLEAWRDHSATERGAQHSLAS